MKKRSAKQQQRDREFAEIKKTLPAFCEICGRPTTDAAHLLPRSTYPEYYTLRENIAGLCRECHNRFDNELEFRRMQKKLYERVFKFSKEGAQRHFQIWE